MNIITLRILGCFYFLFTVSEASNVEKYLVVEPYFNFNQYLDGPYMRPVPESTENMISDLLKGSFQFVKFSLKTIPGPISALSVQLCIANTLKHILKEIENVSDYKLILESIPKRLKADPSVTMIFDPKAIDRLVRMFKVYTLISNKIISENMKIFKKGLEFGVNVMRWLLKEITSMEPESFEEFLEEILSEPPSFNDLASDFMKKIQEDIVSFISNESLMESNGPSTVETLLLIQNVKSSIDENVDPNFEEFSLHFDEYLISDLRKLRSNQLITILNYSEYEIRKVHDYKMSFDYRVNTLLRTFKKPALKQLEENLRRFINYSKSTNFPNLGILLKCIFNESKTDFESKEIEIISYLIQELLSKDSMIRRHCLYEETFDFETFEDNVKIVINNLIKYLRILGSEVKIDKFLKSINNFLFDESIETIKKVIKKFSELSTKNDSYDFDSILNKEEVLLCLELGLIEEFDFMKEYVFDILLGIKEEKFRGNPWLRNLKIESMEKLSTIGAASEKSSSKDDESFFNEVKTQEEIEFDEYFNTFYEDIDFRSSQGTAENSNNNNNYYFDLPIDDYDDMEYYI